MNGLVQASASTHWREGTQARAGRGTAPTTAPGTPTSTATPWDARLRKPSLLALKNQWVSHCNIEWCDILMIVNKKEATPAWFLFAFDNTYVQASWQDMGRPVWITTHVIHMAKSTIGAGLISNLINDIWQFEKKKKNRYISHLQDWHWVQWMGLLLTWQTSHNIRRGVYTNFIPVPVIERKQDNKFVATGGATDLTSKMWK